MRTVLTINVEADVLEGADELIEEKRFRNMSHFFEYAAFSLIERVKDRNEKKEKKGKND